MLRNSQIGKLTTLVPCGNGAALVYAIKSKWKSGVFLMYLSEYLYFQLGTIIQVLRYHKLPKFFLTYLHRNTPYQIDNDLATKKNENE